MWSPGVQGGKKNKRDGQEIDIVGEIDSLDSIRSRKYRKNSLHGLLGMCVRRLGNVVGSRNDWGSAAFPGRGMKRRTVWGIAD